MREPLIKHSKHNQILLLYIVQAIGFDNIVANLMMLYRSIPEV